MALNFPSNPSENDIYQFGLLTYIFKNGKWVSQSRGASQLPWYSNMEQARALWKRLASEAGLNLVDGSFEEGATVNLKTEVIWQQATGKVFAWFQDGVKTVAAGSTPATSGGVGAGAWVDKTNFALREELSSINGAHLVGNTTFYIDDIASADVTNIPDKAIVIARTKNSGAGGGVFYYTTAITETVDNIKVFSPTVGTGRLIRLSDQNKATSYAWSGGYGSGDNGYGEGKEVTGSGQVGNGNKFNYFKLYINGDDTSQIPGVNGATGPKVNGLSVQHAFGGANANGGRHAGEFNLLQGYGGLGATSSTNADRNYVGVQGQVLSDSGDGGTSGSPKGAYFGSSSYAGISNAAIYVYNVTGCEFNTSVAAGSGNRVSYNSGIQIASAKGERGYNTDAQISLSNLSGVGWKYSILLGPQNGAHPLSSDSIILKVDWTNFLYSTIDAGIDLRGGNFSEAAFLTTYTQIYDGSIGLSRAGSSITLGSSTVASTPNINFRSYGSSNNDVTLASSGGTSSAGNGTLVITAGGIATPTVHPSGDNTWSCGLAGFRWNVVYAASGTINTSDEREKTFSDITEAEQSVAKELKSMMRKFQWNDSIKEKGLDGARYHFGVGAQSVKAVFEKYGLDAHRYGLLCYDEWEAKEAEFTSTIYGDIVDSSKNVVMSDVEKSHAEEIISHRSDEYSYLQKNSPVIVDGELSESEVEIVTVDTSLSFVETRTEKKELSPAIEAGNRYGIRYEELMCFIISSM